MLKMIQLFLSVLIFILYIYADGINAQTVDVYSKIVNDDSVKNGAERTEIYFPLLKGKNVAVVANQTSMIGKVHLVDSLLKAGISVKKIFCPEHGFRGRVQAGEKINNSTDSITCLPIISLYGKHFKPKSTDLKGIDIVIYDIQDVGVRFYTYISTMTYVMEACAENNIEFLVLDRPDPNGFYVDGPVLQKEYTSFVGLHPVPVVYGMTIAEYACMVNGEGWLKNGLKSSLKYVTVTSYNHSYYYELPVPPSPNLPNMDAVYLYPSLGLFEGTVVSVGRGTDYPFQLFGHPYLEKTKFCFVPQSNYGAVNPLYKGDTCYGYKLDDFAAIYLKNLHQLYLFWLQETYNELKDTTTFFNSYFNNLAGISTLKQQIISGVSEDDIRQSWQNDLLKFKDIRKKYLLYPDFD